MQGLQMRAYHGMASNYSDDEKERYQVFSESGWSKTRISGILAMLLMYYPDMPYAAIAAFAEANGYPEWEFSLDPSEPYTIGGSGVDVYFVEGFELPGYSEWSADFAAWSKGAEVSELPPVPVPAAIIEDAFNSEPVFFDQENIQPAVYTPPPQQTFTSQPPATTAKTQTKSNMLLYVAGAAALFFILKSKKRR